MRITHRAEKIWTAALVVAMGITLTVAIPVAIVADVQNPTAIGSAE